ncbi:MAG: hypothetical protein LN563_06185, partial [Rickettsia endosymbiont of Platyusa sonomae]|nr:hypothetical protein [Rickettsia endosymbiont of Platyusa sonomae]
DLPIDKAVKKATQELISKVYMRLDSKNIIIPRQVVAQRMIIDLNADWIESSLTELQYGLINGTVAYDYATTFSVKDSGSNDSIGQYAAIIVRECLQQGRWNLTPDKKSVYYSFPTKDGQYLPVMAGAGKILKFDLSELNNPQALERLKQRVLQGISESYSMD